MACLLQRVKNPDSVAQTTCCTMKPYSAAFVSPFGARFGRPLRFARRNAVRLVSRGFTLVEVVLAVVILAILASLGVVSYRAYRDRVDIAKAGSDIAVISASVTEFRNEWGRFPTDLGEIGKNTMNDPWGHGYQYTIHDDSNRGSWRKDKNIVRSTRTSTSTAWARTAPACRRLRKATTSSMGVAAKITSEARTATTT
jgi:prepilin-type N-terminal cleavage/methylation domain-containing protein